jgi:sortase A
MRDKRPVDELSIEELEHILAIRKREERMLKLKRMERSGRLLDADAKDKPPTSAALAATKSPLASTLQFSPAFDDDTSDGFAPRFEDEMDGGKEKRKTGETNRFWKEFTNKSLLLVEVAAVIGLVFLGYNLLSAITVLERETATAQLLAEEQRRATIPTIAPTPQLSLEDFVLPGGHTPPTAPGGAQFNYEEIPANLLPLVQTQIMTPPLSRPAQTDETPLRLIIPKLNLDQSIVQGVDWEALKQGVGQLPNGAVPADDNANIVLAAHNDIYGELFRYLDQLEPGDQFQIQTRSEVYNYVVSSRDIYEPTDVHVMDSRSAPTVTLISCYPYQVNNKRIVVFADRMEA